MSFLSQEAMAVFFSSSAANTLLGTRCLGTRNLLQHHLKKGLEHKAEKDDITEFFLFFLYQLDLVNSRWILMFYAYQYHHWRENMLLHFFQFAQAQSCQIEGQIWRLSESGFRHDMD